MTLLWRKYFSPPFLPWIPLSPSRTLEGLFERTHSLLGALDSPSSLLPKLKWYTVRWRYQDILKTMIYCSKNAPLAPLYDPLLKMAEWLNGRALCLAKAHLYPTTLQCIKLHHLSKACASDTCLVFSAATRTLSFKFEFGRHWSQIDVGY